jgi:hypothetical protein
MPSVPLRVFSTNSWIHFAVAFCALTLTTGVPAEMEFVSLAATVFVSADKFVSEISEFVGVRFAVMPEPRFSETFSPLVLIVAGGMTLETSLSIAP